MLRLGILSFATALAMIIMLMIITTTTKPDLGLIGFPWLPGTCGHD